MFFWKSSEPKKNIAIFCILEESEDKGKGGGGHFQSPQKILQIFANNKIPKKRFPNLVPKVPSIKSLDSQLYSALYSYMIGFAMLYVFIAL